MLVCMSYSRERILKKQIEATRKCSTDVPDIDSKGCVDFYVLWVITKSLEMRGGSWFLVTRDSNEEERN